MVKQLQLVYLNKKVQVNKMDSKKAFAIQFSWIFILIVAFMIMLFVITSITKQTDISETEIDIEVLQNIESILGSSEQSTNTFKVVTTPEMNFEYICEDNYSAYSVNKIQKKIQNLILFSPKQTVGRKFFTWAKEYSMPMKITNILYLTNQKHKYIFIKSNIIDQLISELPSNLTMEVLTSFSEIVDENYDSYTIITTDGIPSSELNLPDSIIKKTMVLQINTGIANYNKGNISFYDGNGDVVGNSPYIDTTLLYGAIFNADYEMYECNLNKILKKSETVYAIYNYVALKQNESESKSVCINNHYPRAIASLGGMIESVPSQDFNTIYLASISLQLANERLQRDGCSIVY